MVSLLNLPLTACSRSSGPSIATTHPPRASSHTIPQYPYYTEYRSPYFGHPAFLSLTHVEPMRFPQATQYPPQVPHPPRTHMPYYMPLISPVGVPILPPLGPPSYHYPPPLVPYNSSQQLPPFSTPVSPFIPPQRAPDWAPIPFHQPPTTTPRREFPFSTVHVSSTPISSVSPIHTQPSESTESLAGPPPVPSAAAANADGERRLFSSAPVPSPEERSVDVPVRPSSAPAVFPAAAPHDARSRPTVPVTQCLDANAFGGQPGPDLPNSRTAGRRHKQ